MLDLLAHRTYRHLFIAQVVALLGTGLATVALGLLAFDFAGARAELVLGGIFAIKMVAYVTVAPIAAAFAERAPRRTVLVALDLVRAAVALALPFVTELWQVFVLIFALQSASAAFTPIYQATIPDILIDEARYTRALSMSRLAYEMENLISPTLAALLLGVLAYDALFFGTVIGFAASAALVGSVLLPSLKPAKPRGVYQRTTWGARIYLATPRLRGLLALNLTVSMAGAMVLVNTIGLVRGDLGLGESAVAWTMGAFGGGAMIAAMVLPGMLARWPDRPVMLAGAGCMTVTLLGFGLAISLVGLAWGGVVVAWFLIGLGYSAVMTPSGRLLRRSAHEEDRPAIFAAQFALSHACWLIGYPLSGWLATSFGPVIAALVLATFAGMGLVAAAVLWPSGDPIKVSHRHDDLPPDHPHVRDGKSHEHALIIDDLHQRWPR